MDDYINPREALYISAISEYKNTKKAAEKIGVNYNALMQTLGRLEKRLNIQDLFIRRSHNLVEENPLYTSLIKKCIELHRVNEEAISLIKFGQAYHEFTIVSSETLFRSFLVPHFKEFMSDHKNISIYLGECNDFSITKCSPHQLLMVTEVLNDEDLYQYIPFHDFTQKLWASQEFINEKGPFEEWDDLNNKPILFQKGKISEPDTSEIKNLIGFRGVFDQIMDKDIKLKKINITGVSTLDALCENGIAIMVSSRETTLLNELSVQNILPEIYGNTVRIYIKTNKKILSESKELKTVVNWIFECRDKQLKKINIEPTCPYKKLRHS